MGNRGSARGGDGTGFGRYARSPLRSRQFAASARRPSSMPIFLARRVRLHAVVPEKRWAREARRRVLLRDADFDVDDLLTAWITAVHDVHAPDPIDSCDDYARYLSERARAARDAGALCRRLQERLAIWIATQRGAAPSA